MKSKRSGWMLAPLIGLALMSCRSIKPQELDSFGLTRVSLHLQADDLAQLSNQSMSKRKVPARITITPGLDTPGEVSFAGRSSLDAYRKSLQLEFSKNDYRQRSASRLSAQLMDPTMLRSALAAEILQSLDIPVSELEWVSAYLNQRYLGLYLLIENVDEEFFTKRSLPIRELYKARFGNAAFRSSELSRLSEAFSEESGSDNDVVLRRLYEALWQTDSKQSLSDRLAPLLHVDLFLRYMAAAVFMNHFDGFSNNYYLALHRDEQRLWTIPWDFDRAWEKTAQLEPAELLASNQLLSKLLEEDESRQLYLLYLEQLYTRFSDTYLNERVDFYQKTTAAAYAADPTLSNVPQELRGTELKQNLQLWRSKIGSHLATLRKSSR